MEKFKIVKKKSANSAVSQKVVSVEKKNSNEMKATNENFSTKSEAFLGKGARSSSVIVSSAACNLERIIRSSSYIGNHSKHTQRDVFPMNEIPFNAPNSQNASKIIN